MVDEVVEPDCGGIVVVELVEEPPGAEVEVVAGDVVVGVDVTVGLGVVVVTPSPAILVAKASLPPPLALPALLVGKSAESVDPVTCAAPAPSTASPAARSAPDPPRYVEYRAAAPSGSSFVTKASNLFPPPPNEGWIGSWRGKSLLVVRPPT
jgi:hypothetical protein